MSTKGRDGGMKEKKGRSSSLPLGQRRSSPTPSVLDGKKGSVLTESRRVYGSNMKKQPLDKTKPPRSSPPSKVTSTRSKPNEDNVTRPSTKITGSTKPKDAVKSRPPLRSKNVVNVKETTNASGKKQTKKGLENNVVVPEQNRIVSDVPPSSASDCIIVTREDDNKTIPVFDDILTSECDKQILDDVNCDILNNAVEIETPLSDPIGLSRNQETPESEIRSRDNATIDGNVDEILNNPVEVETPRSNPIDLSGNQDTPESEIRSRDNVTIDASVDREQANDHDNEIIVQDQENETSEIASDRLLVPDPPKIVVDQENEELEIERVAQDSHVGSKNVEQVETNDQEHKETTQKEPEHEETDPKEPEPEETDPKEPKQEEIEPKEPEIEETHVPKEPEHQETDVPEEPENQETEIPEELPDHEETEPKEPEIEENQVPKEPEHQETEVQEEPENQETEIPEILPDHEETEPKEVEHEETQEPEEAIHEETEQKETENEETEPEEAKHEEIERKEAENEEPEEPKHEETEQKEAEKEELGSKMVVMKKKEVVAHGKKEMGIVYNDVIEETVSKLRRQRKNRVRALVGAFETVISLESDE